MEGAMPFVSYFQDVYPERRSVDLTREPHLVGVLIKTVFFHREEEALLCRALVLQGQSVSRYATVNLKITGIAPVVGYDLELSDGEDEETWATVKAAWSKHFASKPVRLNVLHQDITRTIKAAVFPLKSIAIATSYTKNVRGALTFGDFCPDRGYYLARDGNTPALCSDVMFGRMYFVAARHLNRTVSPSDLVYDHQKSEAEAKRFDGQHADYFYKAACLDIETVFDKSFRDPSLRCELFAYRFPHCTERTTSDVAEYRDRLVRALNARREQRSCAQSARVSIPALAPDMPGQQHEITCVSIVILNSHLPKPSAGHHRKKLMVLYNKDKVERGRHPEADPELARDAGVDDVARIKFYACSGELALLEKTVELLDRYGIELLYVYNAEFDVRVLDQRVRFYAESTYADKRSDASVRKRCSALLRAWHGLFVKAALCEDGVPFFQFENVRYLEMYKEMIKNVGSALSKGSSPTERALCEVARHVDGFNKDKAKLGHFKMNGCGMNVIDLYRMAGTREVKFACTSMKLNDVAPFVIAKARELHGKPPKDPRKLKKLADVGYEKMDGMIKRGGKSLFAVLVYNLVDSQLCARLAKVLRPVSALFHRCRTTLNVDVIVHGRSDNFGGFVQSIHSVQMPQLKFTIDTLRVRAGPAGAQHPARSRWDPQAECGEGEAWKGGAVCDPLTGLHYSGPGMGLELSFDFSSMYPSIMCALNISPETTVPWPPVKFLHDLSGWVLYSWEAEGFEYASLVLKYDEASGSFVRAPGVFASSVEHYLNQRAEFKNKLKNPVLPDADRVYYKMQEGECKVLANSFYGTAPRPCGPLIAAHGRRQIAVVNACVSVFYRNECPVIYGDTDSVMVAVGYGPRDTVEADVSGDVEVNRLASLSPSPEELRASLDRFEREAREAVGAKFKRAGQQVPDFLDYVHTALVEDVLERMYVVGRGNAHQKVCRDPEGRLTKQGYPVYLARVPGSDKPMDVTEPFVENRRVKLEYENSCSVYCHVAKKTYVALTHTLDGRNELSSVSVKVRGLAAFKSMRSPCDSAVTETFIACVMRGDCLKLRTDQLSCLATAPWHQLRRGDVILYLRSEPTFDASGRWLELDSAGSFLATYKVTDVIAVPSDSGFCAVSARLSPAQKEGAIESASGDVLVRTLYKDGKYCLNHIFSRKHAILRDLVVTRACQVIASTMGAGFFPWETLIKSAKNKHFAPQTLERLKVSNSSVKTTYVEIARTWLQRITGLSIKPVECYEFYKCNPCEATFYRYPLNLQASSGCLTAMFGGSLLCEAKRARAPDVDRAEGETEPGAGSADGLVEHPHQPGNRCHANSRVLTAHRADRSLVNRSGKLLAHCIIDCCLPRHMYAGEDGTRALEDCGRWLLASAGSVRDRLKRAAAAFNSVMNNCPEHMIPTCGARELESMARNRETASRLSGEKLETCVRVVAEDMKLDPPRAYRELSRSLGETLTRLISQGLVSLGRDLVSNSRCVSVSLPSALLADAGFEFPSGRLSVARSDLHEKYLVNLAGLIYHTVLMLQICNPDAFVSRSALYPETALCIMPYSCADETNMAKWIEAFKGKGWLKPTKPKLGKRTHRVAGECKEVTYHCTGCKNFYRDLLANKVPAHDAIQRVYDQHKRRRIGRCVSEKLWLP